MNAKRLFWAAPYKTRRKSFGIKNRRTILMLPGAYHTAACYAQTPDGRQGWAKIFAKHGFNVYAVDLPKRAGHIAFNKINGNFLVKTYTKLIKSLQGRVILLTHSLSGPIGFKLAEALPGKVSHLISVEPAAPGNTQKALAATARGKLIKIKFKKFSLDLNLNKWLYPAEQEINRWTKNNTKRFPAGKIALKRYTTSLVAIHPRLIYERFNVRASQLRIKSYNNLKAAKFLIVTGTEDPLHKTDDKKITADFKKHGLWVEHLMLGKIGITGNGHMMMQENNNAQIANLLIEWLNTTVIG